MKFLLLSLIARVALGLVFAEDTTCTGYVAGCTGTTGDPTTCVGQDTVLNAAMTAIGYDISDLTTLDATGWGQLARNVYYINLAYGGVMAPHIDYEPILRCTVEAAGLAWSSLTTCFSEWGSCIADPTCVAAWDGVANNSAAAVGIPFSYVGGIQAIGDPLAPFSLIQDATTNPITAIPDVSLAYLTAFADMANNGKVMAMMSCMFNDWAPTPVDIGTTYPIGECTDLAIACSNDADCIQASEDTYSCAKDNDIELQYAAPLFPTMRGSLATDTVLPFDSLSSHDDWCMLGGCQAEAGNALYLSLGACLMNMHGFSYQKCYDDMVQKIMMGMILVGGVAFVVGILLFTAGWCMCCKSSKVNAHEASV